MTSDTTDLLTQLKPLIEDVIPFVQRCGLRLDVAEPGRVRMTMPAEPNVNHIGTMYAGALFTLAEVPGGALFLATFDAARFYPIIKGMEIRFTKFAKGDISVEVSMSAEEVARVQAEAEEHGKADYSWDCELTDAEGTVVCVTTNHYQLRTHGR